MDRFGSYLVAEGALARAQLEEATQSQVVFGGRLGTNLVELGYLRLDALERHLSRHLGVPQAPEEWLERPDPTALAAASPDQVGRHGFLPLALEKHTLHAAMLDPRHPGRLDDIAFATGLRVVPYVLSELRLTALLEHHYGVARDTRYINLGMEAARGRLAPARAGSTAGSGGVAPAPASPIAASAMDLGPLAANQDLIDEATFSAIHGVGDPAPAAAAPPGAAADAAGVVPAARLESALARAIDRDHVGTLALELARHYADAAALFVVRGGVIAGFRGDGEAIDGDLDGIVIAAEAATIFAQPATTGTAFRGTPPVDGLDARVLAALGRREIRDALVLPIAIRRRVVNLLYVDAGAGALGETAVAAVSALCDCVAAAYERLIVDRKRVLAS